MALLSARTYELLAIIDVPRSQWDPNDNTPRRNRTIDSIDTFELHHTAGTGPRSMSFEDKQRWLEGIERFHEDDKSWSDIFYHIFVFADGEIWGGRRADRYSQGDITTSLTVHIPGDFRWDEVTDAQYEGLLTVARWCTDNPGNVTDHRTRSEGGSVCPGPNGEEITARLKRDLNKEPEMAAHDHQYADLSGLQDAKDAKAKGFWDTSDPTLASSRSTVAVIANRVDNASRKRETELAATVAALAAKVNELDQVGNEIEVTPEVLQVIVDEIQRRLAE